LDNYNPMDLIIEDLYLGNVMAASDYNFLKSVGITHIVRVLKEDEGTIFPQFKYKIIPLHDLPDQNISKHFASVHEFIDGALNGNERRAVRNKVLVHCLVGMSRSSTMVISYLMHKYPGYPLTKALKFVKSKRPIVNPNEGFLRQLKKFQTYLESKYLKEKEERRIKLVLDREKIERLRKQDLLRQKQIVNSQQEYFEQFKKNMMDENYNEWLANRQNFEEKKDAYFAQNNDNKYGKIYTPRRYPVKADKPLLLLRNNGLDIAHGQLRQDENNAKNYFHEQKQIENKKPYKLGSEFDPLARCYQFEPSKFNRNVFKPVQQNKVHKYWSPQRNNEKAVGLEPAKYNQMTPRRQIEVRRDSKPTIRTSHPRQLAILEENYFAKGSKMDSKISTPDFNKRRI